MTLIIIFHNVFSEDVALKLGGVPRPVLAVRARELRLDPALESDVSVQVVQSRVGLGALIAGVPRTR
jgi:hypothetical protein